MGIRHTLLLTSMATAAVIAQPSRISIHHQNLFLSGSNLAWFDFGRDVGPDTPDTAAFAALCRSIHASGGNSLRWWIHVDGRSTPEFDLSGTVLSPGEGTLAGLRAVLDIAWEHEILVDLCLWSFDMLRLSTPPEYLARNRMLLTDPAALSAYITACLTPLVDSLKSHPAILCWEIFNEPEGMSEEFGWEGIARVPMRVIQQFINRCAGAIHRIDPAARVTSGAWSFKSLTDVQVPAAWPDQAMAAGTSPERTGSGASLAPSGRHRDRQVATADRLSQIAGSPNANYYADERLISAGGDPLGTLDFYSVHYYDWAGTGLSPFHNPASAWKLAKPVVAAEFALQQTFGIRKELLYETLYQQGYAGALAWAWTDTAFSAQTDILASLQSMWDAHRADVDLIGPGGGPSTGPGPSCRLDPNFPNPFSGSSYIRFAIPAATEVQLRVYDLLGREVKTLVDGMRSSGEHTVRFDGTGLAGGVYIYQLQAGGSVLSRSMIMIR